MPPRGRSKRKNASESGTSVADSEDVESTSSATAPTTSSSRPRRSRLPKKYFDDEYSSPPSKRRAAGNRETPSDAGDEEEVLKLEVIQQKVAAEQAAAASAAAAVQREKTRNTSITSNNSSNTPHATSAKTPKPRGRPKKNPTPPRSTRKSQNKRSHEEDIIYMDEDSEDDDDESSDDEFVLHEDQPEELEDDLDGDEDVNSSDLLNNSIKSDGFCPWIDQDPATLPKLDLPDTSLDIPIPRHSTMDAIEIYEILRSYHRTLRITPFTFEDFCAALISRNNSCIMAEVHMALLRVCLKSDDEELTQYSVTETNNSVNIMIHHMDTLTYAEILRQYIEAYPFADSSVREAINVENYPYVGYEAKLVVLLFMSYRFLYSSEFKKVVTNVGRFQNDENCRVCGKTSGRLVGCTQCEAAFHIECSHLKPFPEVLICNICKKNAVRGVLPPGECVEKEPLRSQPIGRDRYGRYYWFIVRRIVVQSLDESELHYYSTPPQLYQLLKKLDRDYYERDLCEAIRLRIDDFLEQMTLTVEMTAERREAAIDLVMKKNMVQYEYAEETVPQIYLHKDSMKRMAAILRECSEKAIKEEVKTEDPDDATSSNHAPSDTAEDQKIHFDEDTILPESMLGIFDGRLINTFWSGGATQEDLVEQELYSQESHVESGIVWRMGDERNDQSFMQYYNYYSRNEMAESFLGRKKQTDKKKYMASKFATIDQFEWVVAKDRQFYGNSVLHNKFVGWTLSKIARKIPADLMHRKWAEMAKGYDVEVVVADDFKKLAKCLLQLDAATRKTIFMPQWWNGLGQTKLERITVEQRENFTKEQQRIKKMEADALAKELDDSFIRVNYSKPKWPNTYILRQKGETYRNAGKGQMGGWAWVARKYKEKWVPVPEKPQYPLPIRGKDEEKKIKASANRKARRLESLITRMARKRDTKSVASRLSTFDISNKCYSPSCRNATSPNPKCYSPMCRNGFLTEAKQKYDEEQMAKRGVIGEDRPWPIPEIQTFSTRRGGKSIFVLQRNSRIMRSLILTAGCQQVYMPGFSPGIKSNLLIWPYPAPRPTLDLCWKWQTLNSRSLHSVALQLKIMWSTIKWNEFDPDDSHPDRRVVIDTPNHDERRRIIRHKEMPPYGQYERYELEIEIIPLYEEQEEEDESWLSRNRATDCSQRTSSNRKKRPQRSIDNRQATAIRKEWVDGVTLKVYEIKDYWKSVRQEAEKMAKRKMEAAKKAQRAREDAEKLRLLSIQRSMPRVQPPSISSMSSSERVSVPYMGVPRISNGIGGRYLEKYNNTSHLPPRTGQTYLAAPQSSSSNPSYRVQPNPIRRPAQYVSQHDYQPSPSSHSRPSHQSASSASSYQHYSSGQQQSQRAAAGAEYVSAGAGISNGNTFRAVMMTPGTSRGPGQNFQYTSNQPPLQSTSQPQPHHHHHHQRTMAINGSYVKHPQQQYYQDGTPVIRNGGSRIVVGQQQGEPQRRVVVTHIPSNSSTPNATNATSSSSSMVEEAMPPPTQSGGRYDGPPSIPVQPHRQYHPGQEPQPQMIRTLAPGTKTKMIYLKSSDGGTQKMLVRPSSSGQPPSSDHHHYPPPGTMIQGGTRLVSVRPNGAVGQAGRQVYNAGTTPRVVRVQQHQQPPNSAGNVPFVRRIVQQPQQYPQQQQQEQQQRPTFQDYTNHDLGAFPPNTHHPANPRPTSQPRFVIKSSTSSSQPSVPRGGMTIAMVKQQPSAVAPQPNFDQEGADEQYFDTNEYAEQQPPSQ